MRLGPFGRGYVPGCDAVRAYGSGFLAGQRWPKLAKGGVGWPRRQVRDGIGKARRHAWEGTEAQRHEGTKGRGEATKTSRHEGCRGEGTQARRHRGTKGVVGNSTKARRVGNEIAGNCGEFRGNGGAVIGL